MGFFDELGTIIGDITSVGGELKNTADEAIQDITASKDELITIKDDAIDDLTQIGESLKDSIGQK